MQQNIVYPFEKIVPCIKVTQPIGEFYIASINSKILREITFSDVRRIEGEERGFESYLGIQRPLQEKRVKEIIQYTKSPDACFPTAVILSISSKCAEFDESKNQMILKNYRDDEDFANNIDVDRIAKVLDGQHRIEGLREYTNGDFEINVSIFVDIDIAEEAFLFSTVNLAQTKVNKSLVYDLYDLAKARSPQKLCHNIAVALDQHEKSPFYQRIKRLGSATKGRLNETLTQATFVEALLKYITLDAGNDRTIYLKGEKPPLEKDRNKLEKTIFRNLFIEEKDLEITDIIWNYFDAVRERWNVAWEFNGQGLILNKTNGFKALMRFLKPLYLHLGTFGDVLSKEQFLTVLNKININDEDFTPDNYKPGSSGESMLYRDLLQKSGIKIEK
ncbi:MAG: DGQHR domain-containing protein [Sulfurospirillaceae bacterium]|nr:DGQHR domain-containing protein [Sulfurospirillaceae bacterium]